MKKLILNIILILSVSHHSFSQGYSAGEIISINQNTNAQEGNLYHDTDNDVYYIGTTNGSLILIGDQQNISFNNSNNELSISNGNSINLSSIDKILNLNGSGSAVISGLYPNYEIGVPEDKSWLKPNGEIPINITDNIYSEGNVGIGIQNASNRLEIGGTDISAAKSGLRLNNLANATPLPENTKTLSIDLNGDVIVTESATSNNWFKTGNSDTVNNNFLGTTNDIKMQIRSNNVPILELGRRQTLGLTQNYPDYNNNDQTLAYVRGFGGNSALQFQANGASFYKPMFFTVSNGSFRLKGSAGITDLFEIGSAGPSNDGRLEFIIGDDGPEPIIFKRYDYRNGQFHTEFFRVQGSSNSANAKTRFGINLNPQPVSLDAAYNNDSNNGFAIANSTFQVAGSVSLSIIKTTGNLSLTEDNYTVIVTGNHSITLPAANTCQGRIYIIKNIGGFTINTSTFIDRVGNSRSTINNGRIATLQSDGDDWQQINRF